MVVGEEGVDRPGVGVEQVDGLGVVAGKVGDGKGDSQGVRGEVTEHCFR